MSSCGRVKLVVAHPYLNSAEKCLVMCGLAEFADAMVGTLGVEQRKRTTIGVELAAKVSQLLSIPTHRIAQLRCCSRSSSFSWTNRRRGWTRRVLGRLYLSFVTWPIADRLSFALSISPPPSYSRSSTGCCFSRRVVRRCTLAMLVVVLSQSLGTLRGTVRGSAQKKITRKFVFCITSDPSHSPLGLSICST